MLSRRSCTKVSRTSPDHRKPRHPNTRYTNAKRGLRCLWHLLSRNRPHFWNSNASSKPARDAITPRPCLASQKIPCDNQIRTLLDPIAPRHFETASFWRSLKRLDQHRPVRPSFRVLRGQLLVSLDGTTYFASQADPLPQLSYASPRQWTHAVLSPAITPVVVCPGRAQVIALRPEFIVPQDGHPKQDCEQRRQTLDGRPCRYGHAASRDLPGRRPVRSQPFCALALDAGLSISFSLVSPPPTPHSRAAGLWAGSRGPRPGTPSLEGRSTEVLSPVSLCQWRAAARQPGGLDGQLVEMTISEGQNRRGALPQSLYHQSPPDVRPSHWWRKLAVGDGKSETKTTMCSRPRDIICNTTSDMAKQYLAAIMLSLNLLGVCLFHTGVGVERCPVHLASSGSWRGVRPFFWTFGP